MIEPTANRRLYQTSRSSVILGFEIPKGFVFDGMSVPWFLRSFFGGPYRPRTVEAVLLHDWLYGTGRLGRKEADLIFYRHLVREGVRCAFIFYLAVRLFGWRSYNFNFTDESKR